MRATSRAVVTLTGMPGRGTSRRAIRISDALWDRFGEVAETLGTDRATLIREWIRWSVGEADAEPPQRPEKIIGHRSGTE